MARYIPRTAALNLGGSGAGHAEACAADHAATAMKLDDIHTALSGVGVIGGKWYFGKGLPRDALGNDGDLYLDIDTADVYAKENSTWL